MDGPTVRRAGPDDAALVADLRLAFLRELDALEGDEPGYRERFAGFAERAMRDESYITWIAEADGDVLGCGAVVLYERPASRGLFWGEGCVVSMYTRPDARKRGAATGLMEAITSFATEKRIRLWLLATDDGRPIYERFGFYADPRFLRWRPPV